MDPLLVRSFSSTNISVLTHGGPNRRLQSGWRALALALLWGGFVSAVQRSPLTVAAVTCEIKIRDTTHNLRQVDHWAELAAEQDADLVLFPECTLHGWWQSRENRKFAEPIDGPSIRHVQQIAAKHQILIAVGMTEACQGKYYLTHVLVGPKGVVGFHRKSSLSGGKTGEGAVWDAGEDANVWDVAGWRIGIAICFESVQPQMCQKLRTKGAEVILAPYANGTRPAEIRDPARTQRQWIWQRVEENRIWYVACDATPHDPRGNLVPGAAYVISPEQRLVQCTAEDGPPEGMVVVAIDSKNLFP